MYDPACWGAFLTAIEYLSAKTEHWPMERHRRLACDPKRRAYEDGIMTAIQTADLTATKIACRMWWTWVLAYQGEEQAA